MMQLLLLASLVQSAIAPAVDDFTRTSLIPRDFTDVDPSCTDISNCRTLWSIIYSCLATIFTCVWVAVHKNISHPKQTRVDVLLNSVFTVTLAVLAPEWMLGWAVRQLLAARILAKKLNILGERAKGEWKRERSELSMQDGTDMDNEIILRSGERSELLVQDGADVGETTLDQEEKERLKMLRTRETEESLGRRDDAWSITHGFFVIMGGFQFYKDGDALYPLSPDDVLALVKEGSLIPPTKDEIKSWSKGDWFSKGIAILQTLWFVIQCIARRAEGLPITTLEVMTLAYTVFTVAMYAVWWHKPLNVKYPVRIPSRLDPHPQPENRPGYWITKDWWEKFGSFVLGTQDRGRNLRQDKHVLTFYSGVWESGNGNMSGILALTLVMLVTMVFGGMHCIAWSYAFPSHVETLIWRTSALVITTLPAVASIPFLLTSVIESGLAWNSISALTALSAMTPGVPMVILFGLMSFRFVMFGAVPLYCVARILLLVLSFMPLRALPATAYQDIQWTSFIPHI